MNVMGEAMAMMKNNDPDKTKHRLGRPPLDSEKTRNQRVVTFVTKRELATLKRIAKQEEKSLSAVVHHLISNSLPA